MICGIIPVGWLTSWLSSCELLGNCACGWCGATGEAALPRLKSGAFVRGLGNGLSSGMPNEMMSTMLDTSFLTWSGNTLGKLLPTSLRLQRYIERANSGNRSGPDFVVSDNVLNSG